MVTGSMDKTAILWNLETEQKLFDTSHEGEVISISFNSDGDKILTGSFDKTAKVWDAISGEEICSLEEHEGELSACQFNFAGNMVVTSSIDKRVNYGI